MGYARQGEQAMRSALSVADAATRLAGTFLGQLLQPGDAGYDEAKGP
jgi:hypothetical protein